MASVVASVPSAAGRAAGRYDRVFYGTMAAVMGLTVFVGFGATYYWRVVSGAPLRTLTGGPFTTLVHVHGALFTAWVALFVVQTALVSARKVAVHRRLGIAGAILAAAMIVAGTMTGIATAARGSAPPGLDPLAFLVIPLFDMVLFTGFIIAALWQRRDKESHKRLMLLAYVSIIVAAVARMPGVLTLGPPAFFGLTFLFVIAGAVYDRVTRGRVHRVYLWGGAIIALSVPLRIAISLTPAWHAFARVLTGLVG